MSLSPTQRGIAHLRKAGYVVGIVEHWNAHIGRRQDLFGFADAIAFRNRNVPVMLVQFTTAANAAARRKKILANPLARLWVEAGNDIVVYAWGLRGPRGQRKTWTCDRQWITLEMFPVDGDA